MMDIQRTASLLSQGLASVSVGNNIPSPSRMMFINPRAFFNNTNKYGNWGELITKALLASATEWAANLAALNLPTGDLGATTFSAEAISSYLFGSDGSLFIFYINPKTLNVSHQKITNEVLTGAGWDFDSLGDQISSYDFSGTSGNMLTTIPLTNLSVIKLSRAYLKFVLFEQFYLYNNNDPLIMIFDQMAYIGKLTNLSWSWEADDIYQIKYNFSWRCDPIMSFDPLLGTGVTQLFDRSDIIDIMYPEEIQPDWYLSKRNSINSYETGVRQYNAES